MRHTDPLSRGVRWRQQIEAQLPAGPDDRINILRVQVQ
jgi:hypothetical protein